MRNYHSAERQPIKRAECRRQLIPGEKYIEAKGMNPYTYRSLETVVIGLRKVKLSFKKVVGIV